MNKKEVKKTNNKKKSVFPITPRTVGQKAADWLTKWVGSWIFIGLVLILIAGWIYLNEIFKNFKSFQELPFIIIYITL